MNFQNTLPFSRKKVTIATSSIALSLALVACGGGNDETAITRGTVTTIEENVDETMEATGEEIQEDAAALEENVEEGAATVEENVAEGAATAEAELEEGIAAVEENVDEAAATAEAGLEDVAENVQDEVQEEIVPGDEALTLRAIADDPLAFEGENVTVRGEVNEVFDQQSFSLGDDRLLEISAPLLVLMPDQTISFEDGAEMSVTGTVQNFVIAEMEETFDFDLQDDLYVEYENQPAIIADSFELFEEE
ncbi:MAG: hypothetical protein GFH27_549303n200 [Chloroflexi bacterium AL-W]|nr:hypothetical protein [Chloroflexi bacterium AL-N1]NOK68085.1 hypothetical protein [Chloroflexi bacterium AL-N10]NOK73425.1 hypothetical protein [Chloroflexi bacterium AL-N5]NOK83339.1 hypothetical protein [Chloroflexi bacterium AL-W]NOK87756.1 hypothetical protein [Chloroflexi bacterium AL-N15]